MTIPHADYYFSGLALPGVCEHCGSWKLERAKYRSHSAPSLVVRICNYCARSFR